MPTERETFFIGICVRVSGAAAFVEVRMQRHGATIRDVSGSSRLLFPPHGAIELAGASAGSLSPGDWVAFHVVSDAPQGASVLRVTEHRRLLPLEDLSGLGSSDAIRRLLVEDGRANGVPGELMVRIGEREMVRIELAREQDGRWRAVATDEMARLPVWRFDPKLCLSVPAGSHSMTILDPNERLVQIGTLDWSRDADFVRRIIRSLTRVEAGEDKALRQFAEALGRFADSLQSGASPAQAVDSRIAQEILRLRNLASMLSEQQDVLAAYYEALRDDPEVKSLLERQIATVAQQTVESERKTLHAKLTAELEQDFAVLRAEREADIRRSVEGLSGEMTRELEQRRAVSVAELEADLADRERQGREALESTLGRKRTELDSEVSSLEAQRATLFRQVELLGQRERELSASVEALSTREAAVLETLERMRTQREAEIRKSAEDLGARMTADLERQIAVRTAEFEAELADRARQEHGALEASLGTKRAELEAAVAKLEDRHVVLGSAIEILERRERELSASVDGLSFKEASALDAMELRRAEREAEIKKSVEILSAGMMSDLERRVAARSAELEAGIADRERQAQEAFAARSAELEAGIAERERRANEAFTARSTELEAGIAERERVAKEALAARSAEIEADLAERERQGLEALEASLGSKRNALESEVSSFEKRRISLGNEIELLERRERELSTSVAGLAAREASVLEDLERRRVQREADIKKSVEELSAGMIGDLERRLAARTAEFDAGLANREREAREALEGSLGARRAELHSQVSDLEHRHGILSTEIEQMQQRERELTASIEELSSREASAVQSVAKLSRRILEEAPNPGRAAPSPSGT